MKTFSRTFFRIEILAFLGLQSFLKIRDDVNFLFWGWPGVTRNLFEFCNVNPSKMSLHHYKNENQSYVGN